MSSRTPNASRSRGLNHAVLILLILVLVAAVSIGAYYVLRPVSSVSSTSDTTTDLANPVESSVATTDQTAGLLSLTGRISDVSSTTFSLNDGTSTWALTLKSSTKVRKVTVTKDKMTIEDSDQSVLKDGQRVTVRFAPTLETPISVVAVDILN